MADLENTNLNDEKLEEETEELDFLTMVDDEGRTETFEYLGEVDYKDKTYIAVLPVNEDETEDEEVYFLEVDDNDEGESYISVDDDDLLDEIYEVFKEENSDIYDFE